MNKRLLVFFCLGFGLIQAQNPKATLLTFGGQFDDEAADIIATSDGGYFVTGSTSSFGKGNSDVYVLKLDSNRELEWSKTFGGQQVERGAASIQTLDGGYLIAGYTNSYGAGGYDGYIVKIDRDGEFEYEDTWGGADWDFLYDVIRLPNGEAMLAGETYSASVGGSDAWFIKLNVFGIEIWEKSFGHVSNDLLRSCLRTSSDEIYCVGETESLSSDGNSDHYLIELDLDGEVLNEWTYGGDHDDGSHHISQTSNGEFLLTGYSKSEHASTDKDGHMLRVLGNTVFWEKHAGHTTSGTNLEDEFMAAVENPNGDILYTGYTETFGAGNGDMIASIARSTGWDYSDRSGTIGISNRDLGVSILSVGNEGVAIAGKSNSIGKEYGNALIVFMDSIRPIALGVGDTAVVLTHFEDTLEQDTSLLSLKLLADSEQLSISPSSNNGFEVHSREDYNLQVLNSAGQVVMESYGRQERYFSLPNGSGVYIVLIQNSRESLRDKIIFIDD